MGARRLGPVEANGANRGRVPLSPLPERPLPCAKVEPEPQPALDRQTADRVPVPIGDGQLALSRISASGSRYQEGRAADLALPVPRPVRGGWRLRRRGPPPEPVWLCFPGILPVEVGRR